MDIPQEFKLIVFVLLGVHSSIKIISLREKTCCYRTLGTLNSFRDMSEERYFDKLISFSKDHRSLLINF